MVPSPNTGCDLLLPPARVRREGGMWPPDLTPISGTPIRTMKKPTSVNLCPPYLGAVVAVLLWVDHVELVQHLADDDNAGPEGGEAGGHVGEAAVGNGKGPHHHQQEVHHRHLGGARGAEDGGLHPGLLVIEIFQF